MAELEVDVYVCPPEVAVAIAVPLPEATPPDTPEFAVVPPVDITPLEDADDDVTVYASGSTP